MTGRIGRARRAPHRRGTCPAGAHPAQPGIEPADGKAKIRYGALARCLSKLAARTEPGTVIHMPRIGCGLAEPGILVCHLIAEVRLINEAIYRRHQLASVVAPSSLVGGVHDVNLRRRLTGLAGPVATAVVPPEVKPRSVRDKQLSIPNGGRFHRSVQEVRHVGGELGVVHPCAESR